MIRKLIKRVLGITTAGEPQVIARKQHGIAREQLTPCALTVVDTLTQAGFSAFVVGGAVRDLLLKRTPKDFDVATNARPEEIKRLFRRAVIIGRRFRLVHVMCGNETVEVSTFRGRTDGEAPETDEHGRVLRDNVFGTQAQDAERRDFTINALYYDAANETVVDYQGGAADLKAGVLRTIGDSALRYREDPVRMLRAVRFAAKLGLKLDASARSPIAEHAYLLQNVPAARLFDEILKLLLSGHAVACLQQLRAEGLHHGVLPLLDVILEQPLGERFVMIALTNTDERVNAGKPVSPAFLFATLLWHEVLIAWRALQEQGERQIPALHLAMEKVLDMQTGKLAIQRRYTSTMKEIWAMQPRFEQRSGRRPFRLLEHERFRAAYDFLVLRASSGETEGDLAEWWARFQEADPALREEMLAPEPAKKRRRRVRRRKPEDAESTGDPASSSA